MQSRELDSADVLSGLDGYWRRGKAFVEEYCWGFRDRWQFWIEPTKGALLDHPARGRVTAVLYRPVERYRISDHARVAARALCRLADNPSDAAVAKFVMSYGPLLDFERWIRSDEVHRDMRYWNQQMLASTYDNPTLQRQMVASTLRAERAFQRVEEYLRAEPSEATEDVVDRVADLREQVAKLRAALPSELVCQYEHSRDFEETVADNMEEDHVVDQEYVTTDVLFFWNWCFVNGFADAGRYALTLWQAVHQEEIAIGTMFAPEPIALYIWAAQQMKQLDNELRRGGELSPRMSGWVNYRLAETRLTLGEKPGTLAICATTLLSYLTAQTILDVTGATPVQRACPACGRPFMVTHGRQRFCCPEHARRHRVQQFRQRRRGESP